MLFIVFRMNKEELAKKITDKLLSKEAEITKEIPACGSSPEKDLFLGDVESEPASKSYDDVDLFGNSNKSASDISAVAKSVSDQNKKDRDAAALPPNDVENDNSDDNEVSDTEKDLDQGWNINGEKSDDSYTGSGDGPLV